MIIQAALRKSVERFPDKIALKVEKKLIGIAILKMRRIKLPGD